MAKSNAGMILKMATYLARIRNLLRTSGGYMVLEEVTLSNNQTKTWDLSTLVNNEMEVLKACTIEIKALDTTNGSDTEGYWVNVSSDQVARGIKDSDNSAFVMNKSGGTITVHVKISPPPRIMS